MKKLVIKVFCLLLLSLSLFAIPKPPADPKHPGSTIYNNNYKKIIFEKNRREIVFYHPANLSKKVPLIVFGHGQALDYESYEKSFIHFAKKGFAVVHPQYDRNFFDRKWRRMARDYNDLVAETITRYSSIIDENQLIYSGHSKGAYIALIAAGTDNIPGNLKSVILFSPAGFDEELLQEIDIQVPLTIIRSIDDGIIKRVLNFEIYSKAPSLYKQFIEVNNYEDLEAGHFFPLTRRTLFGGNEPGPFHYHGKWKWILGAAMDENLDNIYIYGPETITTGSNKINHDILKSW